MGPILRRPITLLILCLAGLMAFGAIRDASGGITLHPSRISVTAYAGTTVSYSIKVTGLSGMTLHLHVTVVSFPPGASPAMLSFKYPATIQGPGSADVVVQMAVSPNATLGIWTVANTFS